LRDLGIKGLRNFDFGFWIAELKNLEIEELRN
jgi:hypothetical protein